MNINNIIKISMWLISLILIMNVIFYMINNANTMLNILGFLLLVLTITYSVKTECFTSIRLNFKNRKNEN